MRTTNGRANHSEAENTDYDEDDYYEDEEEAQAEAFLSRKHGEASEASTASSKSNNNNNNNKRSTDQDVADEYAQQEKERKKKARRKVRTIVPDDLIKPKGLTVVRNGIAPKFQSAKYSNTPKSMAKFSRRLMASYADWMDHLSGGLSLHETQWKLKTMGSKTQIKQYLQEMRKSVRDDHVERLLGLETAQRLLGQLEDYYHEEQQYDQEEEEDVPEYDDSNPAITNPYAPNTSNETNDAVDRNATGRASSVAVTPTTAKPTHQDETKPPQQEQSPNQEPPLDQDDPLVRRLALQKEHRARKHVLEDSDEEEEALFDDVAPAPTTNNSTTWSRCRGLQAHK